MRCEAQVKRFLFSVQSRALRVVVEEGKGMALPRRVQSAVGKGKCVSVLALSRSCAPVRGVAALGDSKLAGAHVAAAAVGLRTRSVWQPAFRLVWMKGRAFA